MDPRFGPKVITAQKREMVKMRVKYHLALIVPRNNVQTHTFSEKVPSDFIFHVVETEASITSFDEYDVKTICWLCFKSKFWWSIAFLEK